MTSTPASVAARIVIIATLLQAMFLFFFLFPAADPKANGLDVAVAGPPEAAAQLEQRMESQGGDVEIVPVRDASGVRAAVRARDAEGGFVLTAAGPQEVVVASAGSFVVAELLSGVGAGAPVVELAPLPPDDPRGLAVNTLLIPVIVTSVLLAILTAGQLPTAPARSRLPLLALSGALGGLIAVALATGWLDLLEGPWLAVAGLIALTVIAVAAVSSGIIRLLGPAAAALPFLLFLMLGVPASGAASAPELLPTPWYPLGLLLPPGALADGLRAVTAFDGTGSARDVAVLLVWAALGVALNLLVDQRTARRSANSASQREPITSTA